MNSYGKEPSLLSEKNFFFEISTIESLSQNLQDADVPVRSPNYQIVWITKGSGTYCIDLENYRIADNSVYMIPPGRIRQSKADGDISGYVLSLNTDFLYLATDGPGCPFFEEVVSDFNKINMLSLTTDCVVLRNLLQEMTRECDSEQVHRLEILGGLMKVFLI